MKISTKYQSLFRKKQQRNVFKESQRSTQNKDNYFSTEQKKSYVESIKEDQIDIQIFETMSKEVMPSTKPNTIQRMDRIDSKKMVKGIIPFSVEHKAKNSLETSKKYENYFSNRNRNSIKKIENSNLHNSDPPGPYMEYSIQAKNQINNQKSLIKSPGSKRQSYSRYSQEFLNKKIDSNKQSNISNQNTNYSMNKHTTQFPLSSNNGSVKRSYKAKKSPNNKSNSQLTEYKNISKEVFKSLKVQRKLIKRVGIL
jgi:hypothetical protein